MESFRKSQESITLEKPRIFRGNDDNGYFGIGQENLLDIIAHETFHNTI